MDSMKKIEQVLLIPHHPVKNESNTTPIRTAVVNNLEAKISFNDCIESHFSQLNKIV